MPFQLRRDQIRLKNGLANGSITSNGTNGVTQNGTDKTLQNGIAKPLNGYTNGYTNGKVSNGMNGHAKTNGTIGTNGTIVTDRNGNGHISNGYAKKAADYYVRTDVPADIIQRKVEK